MRRTLLIVAFVGAAGVVTALAYSAYARERDFDRLVAEGDAAILADRLFPALEAYSGAIALNPDAMAPFLKRGSVYRAQGEREAAIRDLRRAVELDPSATRALEWLGDLSLELDRVDRAVDHYERYLALDDDNAAVQYKLGLARYRAGFPKDAVAALDRALSLDPSLNDARFLLGLCHRDAGDADRARRALEEAVQWAPAAKEAREALADVYARIGDHRHTIEQLEALAALDPSRPERLVAVGLAQARAGRDDQAVITLGRAVERFPDAPQAYAALGHVWLRMAEARGDHVALVKALEALTTAADHSTSTSATLTDLGRSWLLAGDTAAAERAFRQAVTRLPAAPDAFLQLASVSAKQGRTLEARDALLQYAALVGDRQSIAPVALQIADLSVRIGEPTLAVRWLDRALDEAGPSAVILARLADAALRAGDVARARTAVDEGLILVPDDPGLLALKRRVASDPSSPAARLPGN